MNSSTNVKHGKKCIMNLKRIIAAISFLFTIALTTTAQSPTCYRIYISDKSNSEYSVGRPEEFLSQRAIDKRRRFNIPVSEQDFPVNRNYIDEIKQIDNDIQILTTSKWMNTATVYCPDSSKVAEIESLGFVDSLIPVAAYILNKNHSDERSRFFRADSAAADSTTYHGNGSAQIEFHNGDKLHEAGFKGEGMLIAVIDGGWYGVETCDFYKKLVEDGRFGGMYDLMPDFDTSLYPSPYMQAHGTVVTSVMASNEENVMVGTAPEASYVFIHSEYSPKEELIEEDFWARAAEIADSLGADVVNSSLGYTRYDNFPQANTDYSTFDGKHSIASLAASILTKKGVIPCIAAGNDGNNDWYYIGKPSDADDVLAVGACSTDSVIAAFSSHGFSYDGRVKPDVVSIGVETACYHPGNQLGISYGTSLATPVIAGLCACLWQALPAYTPSEIMQRIREKSHQFNNPDPDMGYGIPDFFSVFEQYSGIKDHDKSLLTVFPNPTNGTLNIQFSDGSEMASAHIYDLQGRIIAAGSISPINLNDIPSGLYILLVTDNNGAKYYQKIVKQ